MLGDVEPKAFTYSLDNLEALTKRLPQIAQEIATSLELEETRPLARSYERIAAPESVLEALYKQLFQWELKLLLTLWGQEWAKDDITAARAALLTAAKATGVEFGAWAAARVLSRAMLPGFQPVGESLMSGVPEVVDAFTEYSYPVVVLAVALYRLNYAQEAYDLLEEQLERTPQELDLWLALAELYLASRQLTQVIRAFQDAIEEGAVSTRLYLRYAEILRLLSFENYPLNDFMLISPEDFEDDADLIRWETIEAYEEVLKLVPDHQDALYQQLLQMAEVEDERFWEKFEALVKRDKTGDKVRSVIDALYDFEDVDEGIAILKRAIDQEPKRYDLHANLGDLYLFVENTKAARTALNTAKELTNDEQARADIDRLLLSVEDPEFEARLGELTDIVNAGSELDIEHVEFLEGIVEKAPRFGELYVLLGKAYLAWGEPDTALETLLDGQKYLPLDPDILELLGRVLWELDQRVLAFEYLNKGIAENPTHVPLLARMGRCHFDNDETELSKVYLLRAEAVNPRHPALSEARAYISRMLEAGEEG
jgi:tetratricopeptide (TPR) repeat protein